MKSKRLLCALAALMIVETGTAQTTYTWTNTVGGTYNWTDTANWTPAAAPNPVAGDEIYFNIPNGSSGSGITLNLEADRTAETWRYVATGGFDAKEITVSNTGGYKVILAGTTPTLHMQGDPVGGKMIFNCVVDGTSGLTKAGDSWLKLTNTGNTFSGGIVLANGTIEAPSDACLGNAANGISVTNSGGQLTLSNGTYARSLTLGTGAVATIDGNITTTISGDVTGDGGIATRSPNTFGTSNITLSSTNNTFTGPISLGVYVQGPSTLTVNSLGDGANPLTLRSGNAADRDSKFVWGSGATSALTLNQRVVTLAGSFDHAIENANTNPAYTITINPDLTVTAASATRVLILRGVNTGDNTFAGDIPNGASGEKTSLTKEEAGKWILAGTNTYLGNTTVSAGTLVLGSTGQLAFAVEDITTNKVTGAGSATFNGTFSIDTSAVTFGTGPWTLVDTTTSSYGGTFSVAGYTNVGSGVWQKPSGGGQIWSFAQSTGKLYLNDPAQFVTFGIPGSAGVINNNLQTIDLTVPYTPWGITGLATLAPTFALSSGTCDQTSGAAPSPNFAVQNPATYTATDTAASATNPYTVTVTVTAASTAKVMSNVFFPGVGYAWSTSATDFLIVVPNATNVTALAPTFSISQFATVDVSSGTARDFTTPQTYTVTAEDGLTQAYTVTVQKITAPGTGTYQQKVLASGPVSYWPLNETSGTTAIDLASGLNPITYGGTYTLNQATAMRADGNPSVLFTTAAAGDANNTRAPLSNSLNAKQFTVECWVKPTNTTVQYLVSLQDRTNYGSGAGRIGYALWKNNATSFGMQWGTGATTTGSINGTTPVVAGNVYHVVGTYDGTTMRIYINGNLENSASVPVYAPAGVSQPGFTIGSRNGVNPAPSYIQDVALYTRALSPSEILTHYQNPPANGFATWQSTNSASGQTLAQDHDNDGVSNGIEWFLGGNTNTTGFTTLPGVTNTLGTLSVTWVRHADYPGFPGNYGTDFVVETSATLTGTWTAESSPGNVTITGNNVKYTFPSPLGDKNFARLKVTGP